MNLQYSVQYCDVKMDFGELFYVASEEVIHLQTHNTSDLRIEFFNKDLSSSLTAIR